MNAATDDQLVELWTHFQWSPAFGTLLDVDACLGACAAWSGLAAADSVHVGQMSAFAASVQFGDTLFDCPLVDTDTRRQACVDIYRDAFALGLADLRNGAVIWAGDPQ